jgi:hypothetical protein
MNLSELVPIILGSFFVGFIIAWKLHSFIINVMIDLDMKNGQCFVFRKGKWYPHNPRLNHKSFELEVEE